MHEKRRTDAKAGAHNKPWSKQKVNQKIHEAPVALLMIEADQPYFLGAAISAFFIPTIEMLVPPRLQPPSTGITAPVT